MGDQDGFAVFGAGPELGVPRGAGEPGKGQVDGAAGLVPAQGVVRVPFLLIGFVVGLVGIDDQRRAQASLAAGEGAFAEPGQQKEVERAVFQYLGDAHHGLAQLVLAVDVLDQVGLIDDVDQVLGFGHPPEYLVDAGANLPAVGYVEVVELADISVGAFFVRAVDPQEGDDSQPPLAVAPAMAEFGLETERWPPVFLSGPLGVEGEDPCLDGQISGPLHGVGRGGERE